MPATLVRPSPLHLCSHDEPEEPAFRSWSASSSDSDDREDLDASDDDEACTSPDANSDNSDDVLPTAAPVPRLLSARAPTRPAGLGPRLPSPPRTSPLSPLAAAAAARSSVPSASTLGGAPRAPRPRGLSPLSPVAASSPLGGGGNGLGLARGAMPKATPLARTLLNRSLSGGPSPAAPKKPTKIIVPTKPFRTSFDLGLSSKELQRRP